MIQEVFDQLWKIYTADNQVVKRVYDSFNEKGERVVNDHIAFRTFNLPQVNIEKLARVFLEHGYEQAGEYHFPAKKLYAKHYAHPTQNELPKVFISELLVEEFSTDFQHMVKQLVDRISDESVAADSFIYSGVPWGPLAYDAYERFAKESEYAAWLYANGFVANHFTVSVNHLNTMKTLQEVNAFLKANGFALNAKPNEIQGTPEQFLEQSSIKAGTREVKFEEGVKNIPACYYEFALRYPMPNGELYEGFIAQSADKIFESTDR